ncbi:unnamed protein product [Protopolystoma xenopodis]|uniref:Uncharacterized protein n=1 Tax=Protopolystoma xenopodis TaxID=117903 RepID=A0A448WR74_9PLAT|nr:unnamed protein product [Protopolystoma xenopodis]
MEDDKKIGTGGEPVNWGFMRPPSHLAIALHSFKALRVGRLCHFSSLLSQTGVTLLGAIKLPSSIGAASADCPAIVA